MPVTVSSFALSWLMVHDGVTRRSTAALSEMTCRGTSAMVRACRAFLSLPQVTRRGRLRRGGVSRTGGGWMRGVDEYKGLSLPVCVSASLEV